MADEQWLGMLIRSVATPVIRGLTMPPFPDDGLQKDMVGSAGEYSLREAFGFYREVKAYYGKYGLTQLSRSEVLDFGCGWGRHLRFFLKDVPIEKLRGVDVDASFVDISRSGLPGLRVDVVDPLPPTMLQQASLDLVYAYSVFSHLAEHAHQAWVTEFHRILRPGGLLVVTTQRRAFLDFCESLRRGTPQTTWHRGLAASFVDVEGTKRAHEDGQFIYSPTGGGGVRHSSYYGEAIVSPGYIHRTWCDRFEIIDFVDDDKRDSQAIIVARNLASPSAPMDEHDGEGNSTSGCSVLETSPWEPD